ncbi:S-adenosyl-L-methionine-dependent methyltransferase [Lepidopterella palustris CBS 459.81]|uniref:S-adenosyl-L-methionine-dependent methyltransferase n=1 Tax=Lepidopterella palustris CBS 459.81 TaxID=1314670 RepID=A0A8E2JG82_9PEZI|nr:S-adenosyl-L-methionine-dependent methyltransferase [Lepidopterella palustris CBS 459.81]
MFSLDDNLADLAALISSSTAVITRYLEENRLPQPSFRPDAPGALPEVPEVQGARMALIEAAAKIQHLATGADDFLWQQSLVLKHDQAVIDVFNQFDVWDAVSLNQPATYASIAAKTGLSEPNLRRLMRHAMTIGLFTETAPGSEQVVHTASSYVCVRRPLWKAWIGHNIEEVAASSINLTKALRTYGDSQEPAQCAMGLTFFPDFTPEQTFFDWLSADANGGEKGWRVGRFGQAMSSMASLGLARIDHINAGFDWDSLGKATVVDIGGSIGHTAIELASKHPDLTLIIQDFASLEPQHAALVPSNLRSRISFQAHDFFTPQTVHGADVYFLKHILHDWSDHYALRILRNLIPALKPGARVIIMDGVVPPRDAVPLTVERLLTSLDLQMMTVCNSKERMAVDWMALFKEADERFDLKAIVQPPGSAAALIEVIWKG